MGLGFGEAGSGAGGGVGINGAAVGQTGRHEPANGK